MRSQKIRRIFRSGGFVFSTDASKGDGKHDDLCVGSISIRHHGSRSIRPGTDVCKEGYAWKVLDTPTKSLVAEDGSNTIGNRSRYPQSHNIQP